jgi:hypothetical protein
MTPILSLITLAATLIAAAPQHVSDGELQLFIARSRFPTGCGSAQTATNALRAKPSTDPAVLEAAAKTYHACAVGPYGLHSNELANLSYFAASSALLLAARHSTDPDTAHHDAKYAAAYAQTIIDFRQTPGNRGFSRPPNPSPLITDAGRIKKDATALLAAPAAM